MTKDIAAKYIQYISTGVMYIALLVWIFGVSYSAVIVWRDTEQLSCFVDLVKGVAEAAVIGYFGRIALTHAFTLLKTGKGIVKDFVPDEIVADEVTDDETEAVG